LVEGVSKRDCHLAKVIRNDVFSLVIACSRCIGDNVELQKMDAAFLNSWRLFADVLDRMLLASERLNNEVALSLARIIFISSLIFDMPKNVTIQNIVSNPKARRLNGTYPASADDVAFSNSLPSDLAGPFKTGADIFSNLDKNLKYYLNHIERS